MAQTATLDEVPGAIHYRDLAAGNLWGWLVAFTRCYSPRAICASLAVMSLLRLLLGGVRTLDAVVVAGFIVAQPFTEWVLHVTVLHFKPTTMLGRKIDLYAARKHRAHHRDPELVQLVFIQKPIVLSMIFGGALLWLAAFRDLRLAATALWISLVLMLFYEWTHYLIHSPYVPRSRLYRYVWRAHRLHHFKNERYWFGITVHVADHVLGTFPDKSAVPTSQTCRTLGVDIA
jgi:hypothetical protein